MTAIPKPTKRGRRPQTKIRRKARLARAPKQPRKKLKAEADKLFSLYVRERDGYRCRLCGSTERPQCAHLFSRRYLNTRWDPENAWCLCCRDHMRYTHRPLEWDDLLREKLGSEKYKALRARALGRFDGDLELIIVMLLALRSGSVLDKQEPACSGPET